MPKLIKNGTLQDNPWTLMNEEDWTSDSAVLNRVLLPLAFWLANPEQFTPNMGVWLRSDEDPELLSSALAKLPAIAIVFGIFSDGRGFSLARMLREDFDFSGELQAAGDFMQDQLCYLQRCGFDAFVVADDADTASMMVNLRDFSDSYQATYAEPRPLFRRR
jgi:uncharacterized protein (DUF934 family)